MPCPITGTSPNVSVSSFPVIRVYNSCPDPVPISLLSEWEYDTLIVLSVPGVFPGSVVPGSVVPGDGSGGSKQNEKSASEGA